MKIAEFFTEEFKHKRLRLKIKGDEDIEEGDFIKVENHNQGKIAVTLDYLHIYIKCNDSVTYRYPLCLVEEIELVVPKLANNNIATCARCATDINLAYGYVEHNDRLYHIECFEEIHR